MRNNLQRLTALLLLLIFTIGCSVANKIVNELDKTQPPKILNSTDGKSQISVPSSWTVDKELNQVADIQASNRLAELYVVVISESKGDFGQGFNFDLLAKSIQDDVRKKMTNGEVLGQTESTVNGYPAKLFEATGEIDKVKVKYLYALVNSPQNFHQILTWTLQDRYDENKEKLQSVINSFKETEISPPSAPSPVSIKPQKSK